MIGISHNKNAEISCDVIRQTHEGRGSIFRPAGKLALIGKAAEENIIITKDGVA